MQKTQMTLAQINAFRERQGWEPLAVHPNVARPGKTAAQNKSKKNANAAARADANRAMKSNRHKK